MRVSKSLVISLLLCLCTCIDPYQPEIGETQDLLVVNGLITDTPGIHTVEVSRASPYNQPEFIPVENCVVRVEDNEGTGRIYSPDQPGMYRARLDRPFLSTGKAYKLIVLTPDGKEYQSDYDTLLPVVRLDRLYYEVESQETSDPENTYYGIRFYVDVKPEPGASRNILWKLVETWEYSATYLIQYIWADHSLTEFSPPTDSLFTCYKTQPVRELYAASTQHLVSNELNHYPLNYVSNQTSKLLIKYSLLVRQHSLSEEAYRYWNKVKGRLTESGGLYEAQPSGSRGNICNVDDPEELVLGCFYASQVTERRILVNEAFDFLIRKKICELDTLWNLNEIETYMPPVYMISLNFRTGVGPPYGISDHDCFNCTYRGGVTQKPEYWDDDE